jgi:hypothetical protein
MMLPNAQPKGRPSIFDKRDTSRERMTLRRSVYAAVDARDHRECRCCGRRESLHHHHLTFRSKGGGDCTTNVLLLCRFCHALLHARQLWILGKNADKRLTFEVHEAAVVDLFGVKPVPRDVRIITNGKASV